MKDRGRRRQQRLMGRRLLCLLALAAGVFYPFAFHPVMHAQDDSFWSFLKPGRVITPCLASSAAHKRAAQRLENLRELVTQLRDDEPVSAGVDGLHALLKSECFLLASEISRVPAPDTSMSLKRWWESGGAHWLESYLELPRLGYTREEHDSSGRTTRTETVMNRHVVVPPDARRTLTSESGATHVLREFLCPADSSCNGAHTGTQDRKLPVPQAKNTPVAMQFLPTGVAPRQGRLLERSLASWNAGGMTQGARRLIAEFDALSEQERSEVLAELARRAGLWPHDLPRDKDLLAAAALLFVELDQREAHP